jgi:hypothetical protein
MQYGIIKLMINLLFYYNMQYLGILILLHFVFATIFIFIGLLVIS